MEDIIIYGIVAIIIIANLIRSYNKKDKNNNGRTIGQPRPGQLFSPSRTNTPPSNAAPAPFSRRVVESNSNTTSTVTENIIEEDNNASRYDMLSSINVNYAEEGVSAINRDNADDKKEEYISDNVSSDLKLETQEDLRRAFIHTIVLERKY